MINESRQRENTAALMFRQLIRSAGIAIDALIRSNIYISLAAAAMLFETQIMLGMEPQFQPYVVLIFFATLIAYGRPWLGSLLSTENLNNDSDKSTARSRKSALSLMSVCAAGVALAAVQAKASVLAALVPVAAVTYFYSPPVSAQHLSFLRLRQVPFLKVFIVAFAWSSATIIPPAIQSGADFSSSDIWLMLAERFIFIFAITLPFDIRDMRADRSEGIKTIPMILGEKNSVILSVFLLTVFSVLSAYHFLSNDRNLVAAAMLVSGLTTSLIIAHGSLRYVRLYHRGILDGTMIIQALLVLLFNFLSR